MKDNNYRLGLVSVSFRAHTPWEVLEAMKEADLHFIEWGSDVHAPYNDTQKLRELVALQEEYGVLCSSYGTYFRLGQTPIDELEAYINAAKILGTDVLRLWCGTKSSENMTPNEKEFLIDQCKNAADIAKKHDVILCMECHKSSFTQRIEGSLELMQAVNSANFRMYWQPFQWQSATENLAYAEAIAPYTHHIHVFQWKDRARFSLFDGIQEWQQYLEKFKKPKTLLLEFMPDDQISSLKTEAKALKFIIGDCQ